MRISTASLRILEGWADTFAGRGPIGRWQGGEANATGVIQMPWYEYSDEINRFVAEMYSAKLVRPVDWMQWAGTPEAQQLMRDPAEIAGASHDDLIYLLTTIVRGERFSDGEIAGAYERGTLLAITERAGVLVSEGPVAASHGPLWDRMDAQPRNAARVLTRLDMPTGPGAYAWYRRGRAVYVGKADDLRDRVWARHMGQSRTIGTSAFRRNVAEHLGFGTSADIKARRVRLTDEQLSAVRAWILGCRVAWIVCRTIPAALALESALKAEWMPPLTKQ